MNRRGFPADSLLLLPMAGIVLLVGIAPFGEAVFTSFFHDIYGQRTSAGLSNYAYIFSDRGFYYSLKISLLWAFCNTVLSLGISLRLAWYLSRTRKKITRLYLSLLVPWGTPIYIAVPLWRSFFHGDGGDSLFRTLFRIPVDLMNDPIAAFLAALWVSLWMSVPFMTFLFWGSFRKIPKSYAEAARMDGANSYIIFKEILIPEIRGSIGAMTVINFLKFFKEFNLLFLMTTGGPPLISGMTSRHIIGATTTLDLFLYEVFKTTEDLGITSAYAVCLAGLVIILMGIWLAARREKGSHRIPLFFLVVSQIVMGGLWGLIWGGLYLVAWTRNRKSYLTVFLIHCLINLGWIFKAGFFEGFHPEILAALVPLLITQSEERSLTGVAFSGIRNTLLITGTALLRYIFMAASLLIFFLVIWLSLSGIGACSIDSLIPPFATLSNYRKVLVEENMLHYFFNTLKIAAAAGLLIPFIVLPSAIVLRERGVKTVFMVITGLQIIGLYGGMHSMIPLYALFRRLHLLDSYLPLILIYLNHSLTTGLITSVAYLEKIPSAYREAADLEGISALSYMTKIILPLSFPILTTNGILAFLSAWNGFMAPLLFLNQEEKFTISIKLFSLVGNLSSGRPQWHLFATASIVNCLIIGGIFFYFKRPLQNTALGDDDTL